MQKLAKSKSRNNEQKLHRVCKFSKKPSILHQSCNQARIKEPHFLDPRPSYIKPSRQCTALDLTSRDGKSNFDTFVKKKRGKDDETNT